MAVAGAGNPEPVVLVALAGSIGLLWAVGSVVEIFLAVARASSRWQDQNSPDPRRLARVRPTLRQGKAAAR
jgi:hypothetical protein